ncbi:MAG: hypothetical protein KJO05_01920 [Bacteroidia bacterium]|nr:hypothetical protein [Bacteroidia bacterium]NNF29981.1 hypothetical protein [Flavobacteriaceae bacterium]MBT8276039.1 hypothetical protein [Bacteroidia bacterium]NNJ80878.1 hypothetical protein [Flavobacteriaceae bacterium]NNK53686.1 hypothetical protein [Flavobacteriaceae bacterium]
MKSYKAPAAIFLLACFVISGNIYSQVGINTTNPRKTLEVAGDMTILNGLEITNFTPQRDTDTTTFLIQEGDNSIKSLDVSNPTGVALAYIQEYVIEDPDLDWVKDFDTGIDASNYVVIVTSASFNQELDLTSNPGVETNSSIPFASAFIDNGTWHLVADYPQAANLDETQMGIWTISTLIFSNDVSKQFGTVNIPMANTSSGAAASPIIN